MNIDHRIIACAVVASLTTACTPTDINFGNSVRQTMAAQVVNPDPDYENPVPTTEGTKGAQAVDRYRSDKVKQPDTIRTTDTQTGSPR